MSITINGSGPITGSDRAGLTDIAGKNKLINPNFAINQRAVTGTVVLTSGQYGHDRWKAGSGGCTYTFSTSANITTITISVGTLVQVIEGLNLYSGTHTLSWVGTAQGRVDAGSYGASGLTATVTGGTNQSIEFGTGTVSRTQYECGSTVTVFERRSYGLELLLCQRYYQSSNATGWLFAACFSTNRVLSGFTYPVSMRASPSVLLSQSGFIWFYNGGAYTSSAVSASSGASTGNMVSLDVTVAAGAGTAGFGQLLSYALNAEL